MANFDSQDVNMEEPIVNNTTNWVELVNLDNANISELMTRTDLTDPQGMPVPTIGYFYHDADDNVVRFDTGTYHFPQVSRDVYTVFCLTGLRWNLPPSSTNVIAGASYTADSRTWVLDESHIPLTTVQFIQLIRENRNDITAIHNTWIRV